MIQQGVYNISGFESPVDTAYVIQFASVLLPQIVVDLELLHASPLNRRAVYDNSLKLNGTATWTGISAFGIQSNAFQGEVCHNFIESLHSSPKPAIAILFNTFGKNNTCLKRFWRETALLGKRHLTEIHFSNEAGRRMNNLDSFDFLPGVSIEQYNVLLERMPRSLARIIRTRVKSIKKTIRKFEHTGDFILSTGLEDNFTSAAWENIYSVIKSEWSGPIARNRVKNKWMKKQVWNRPPEVFEEYHGYRKTQIPVAPCIVNGDGQDVDFLVDSGVSFIDSKPASLEKVTEWIDFASEHNCVVLLWAAKWQGFFSTGGQPSRPLSRKFRFDKQDIEDVAPLLQRPHQ